MGSLTKNYLLFTYPALLEVGVDRIETIFPRSQQLVLSHLILPQCSEGTNILLNTRPTFLLSRKVESLKPTFLLPPAAPGVVLLELPAFQGSGLITWR